MKVRAGQIKGTTCLTRMANVAVGSESVSLVLFLIHHEVKSSSGMTMWYDNYCVVERLG